MTGTRKWPALWVAWMLAFQAGVAKAQQPRALQASPGANLQIDVFFTPDDDATAKIVAAIAKARQDVRVQSYLFTSHKLANALVRVHRAGIAVEVIVDQEQLEKGGAPSVVELAAAGVTVYVDGQHAAAHNKIILIDATSEAPVVITGSYNFTVAAQSKNAENVLIIRGDRQLAAAYRNNWDSHRKHSVQMQ